MLMQADAAACDVVRGNELSILNAIGDPGVAAVIWQRTLGPAFADWLAGIPHSQLPEMRAIVHVEQLENALTAACEKSGLEASDFQKALVADLAYLARAFSKLMGGEFVRMRLETASLTTCPKFHIDKVKARLLCTYRGQGTEYVRDIHADIASRHRQVKTGQVALLRGLDFPAPESCGLLHRSPVMGDGDLTRLLLVLDPVEAG
ncbi:conserved hypothetical protein [Roseibium sp. TrichSKD4]|uniref:DUF1826 domain-containing protein n=1 Tax=Roseibium sp. TrichSKD4 TaxID=744980 RepID=UPI0001E57596|nr:DUF1826 domain-containing protein [Roseibium sp. TrichSKD4]EFO30892.1 conserved hypothetical protein [Roseibium sp. TrichSKD4]